MSTSDRTGQKLVDSLRKTKAAATGRAAASSGSAAATPDGRQAPGGKADSAVPRPAAGRTTHNPDDPYQSGGRVWPD